MSRSPDQPDPDAGRGEESPSLFNDAQGYPAAPADPPPPADPLSKPAAQDGSDPALRRSREAMLEIVVAGQVRAYGAATDDAQAAAADQTDEQGVADGGAASAESGPADDVPETDAGAREPAAPGDAPASSSSSSDSVDRRIGRRTLLTPPRRQRGLTPWAVLAAVLLVASPALLIDIYHPDVTDPAEAHALATSIHTWQRLNLPRAPGDSFIEEYIPHHNGRAQWQQAPGTTWTQLLTFEIAAPKPRSQWKTTLGVDASLATSASPPLEPFSVSDMTVAELRQRVASAVADKPNWKSVRVAATVRDAAAEGTKSEAAAGDERRLRPGDRIDLLVDYVDPRWRSRVNTLSLIKWGRQGSAVMALLLLAAVFWAGHSIGGNRTGLFAALICAANPVFIFYARLASPAIHQATWATLAVAAALWAIRPLRPSASIERQFLGWVLCGLGLGAAALTTGPIVFVTVAVPILLLLLLCPHRLGHLTGLVAALLIGLLLVVPWTALLHDNDPDAAIKWMQEHQPFGRHTFELLLNQTGSRLLLILGLLLPWTIWLFAAVIQPFSTSSLGSRTRMFLGLTWFVSVTLILLTQPSGDRLDAWLPLAPVGSVMIAQVFRQYADMADQGRFARFWRLLRWPHLLLLIAASALIPLLISMPRWFIGRGWFDAPLAGDWGWASSLGLGVVLLLIVLLSVRYAMKQFPERALVAWACWVLVAAALVATPASRNQAFKSEVRADAHLLASHVHEADASPAGQPRGPYRFPVFAVYAPDEQPPAIDPALLLYAGLEVRAVEASQIQELAAKEKRSFFLVRRLGDADIAVSQRPKPAEQARHVRDLTRIGVELWKYEVAEAVARP